MGEASSVKVSDIEKFASCNLGNTFKVWSLVYTWRYSLDQDECIGFVVQQWLGKSSGSRRVWSCPQEMGQCEGEPSPSWAVLIAKEHSGPSLCPCLSKGSLILLGWASGEWRNVGEHNQTRPREGSKTWICRTNKQTKDTFYCYAIRTPWFVYPQPSSHSLLALPEFEDVPCVPMNNLQTYNTKGMKTDNAIYFALMSSRQW